MTLTKDLYQAPGSGSVNRTVESKLNETVSVTDFMTDAEKAGIVAGTVDVTAAIQDALDSLSSGGTLITPPGSVLLATDTLTMSEHTTFDLNGSTLNFNITGKYRCLVTNNFCTVRNGTVANITSDATVWGAEWQQPVCIGFSNSITDAVHDVLVENLTITSTSPEGNAVFVMGACYNITVQNIDIPDSAYLGEPIGGHWSVEPGGDETQGTGHPNNITFRNIRIGEMSYATGTAACFLSACRNVTLENIFIEDFQNGSAVRVFAGDHGFTYSIDQLARVEGVVLTARNVSGKALKGITVDMRDTLEAVVVWSSSITFDNCNLQSRLTTSTSSRGLDLGGTDGVTIRNSKLDLFYNGVFLNGKVTNLQLENNRITNSYKNGLDADNSADCANLDLIGNKFEGSNTAGGTGYDIVFGSNINNITIERNVFDSPSATYNVYALSAAPPSDMKVINNHTIDAAGTSYVFGSSSSADICTLFNGNTVASTFTNNIRGGQDHVPYALSSGQNSTAQQKIMINDVVASYGTYEQGDIIWNTGAAASGTAGWICVTAGTPGTWKTFGAISA